MTKIEFPSTPMPTKNEDWAKLISVINALTNMNTNIGSIFKNGNDLSQQPILAKGSIINHGGALYLLENDISLPNINNDGTYFLTLDEFLAFGYTEFVSNYYWNDTYSGLYTGRKQVLPYVIKKEGSDIYKGLVLNIAYRNVDNFIYLYDTGELGGVLVLEKIEGHLHVQGNLTIDGNLYVDGNLVANNIETSEIIADGVYSL